jgi:flagellar hook-associated protein 2
LDLALEIQGQLRTLDSGNSDISVTATGTMGNFSLSFKDALNRPLSAPALTVDPSATGASAGVARSRSTVGSERVASVTGLDLGGSSNYSTFSLKVDGVTRTVSPTRGLTSMADLAADLQAKLRAPQPAGSGVSDLTVSVDASNPSQLNITSASGHTYSAAQLTVPTGSVHLDGVKFGTTPAADDFKSFSVVIDGVTRSVTPAPGAATAADLASDLQSQIRAQMGNTDVTVEALGTASGFSLFLQSASGKSITGPKLATNVVDMTPPVGLSGGLGSSPADGVKTGTSSGASLSGISLGTSPSSSNFKAFTVTVDGVSKTVTPTAGLTTLANMATDLQSKLNALVGASDIQVTATGDSLTVSSTAGRKLSGPMLTGTTLDAVSFATSSPSTKDFRGFGLTVDGTNFTIVPSPNATTLDALAADLQSQLRSQDGKNDLSVTVANGQLQFWSASNRAVSSPVLLTNTYELTPSGVARAINDKKLGLTAQVVNTGSLANPYKLVVSSATGAQQAFDIGTNTSAGSTLGFTTLSSAADADIVVDGVAMTRSTNTVSDAITGVTLSLRGTTPGGSTPTPASLDIGLDTTSFKTKMTDMVSSFNDTWDLLNQVADPKSTLETYGATLVGDSVVRTVKQQVRAMFQGASTTPGSTVSSLWQMGIKIDEKGVMTFDGAAFDTTVQSNYSDVVKSLTGNFDNLSTYSTAPAGFAGDAVRKLTRLLDTAGKGGPILSASENANTQNTKYQEDLTKLQTRMDALLARYQKQLAAMDSLVGSTNTRKASLKSTFEGMMSVYTNN